MNVFLQVTPHDPLVSRDGRPFGIGQGRRMRGLPWPLPSVVAGSFRTALVKAGTADFSGDMPQRLMRIAVAGVFPVHDGRLYLPAPDDALAEPKNNDEGVKCLHRVYPQPISGGCDLPEAGLQPVLLAATLAQEDFKPAEVPEWWPVRSLTEWLLGREVRLDSSFLRSPRQETRDHVCLDVERGAAAEGQIFATANLNLTHLPRFEDGTHTPRSFRDRFAEVSLSARVTFPADFPFAIDPAFASWHPMGGERRLVHWQASQHAVDGWSCPEPIRRALAGATADATKVRMVLATPAIFAKGWRPGWLDDQLQGSPPGSSVQLKLVGVSNARWKAVSGWSLAPPRGPKPVRRMVPAGSVYFFEVAKPGDAAPLAELWLQSVSDDPQEQRDGFGLAIWGTW